jgi:hypothetical protein
MEENVCESNDERIYSDSDAIENIVANTVYPSLPQRVLTIIKM